MPRWYWSWLTLLTARLCDKDQWHRYKPPSSCIKGAQGVTDSGSSLLVNKEREMRKFQTSSDIQKYAINPGPLYNHTRLWWYCWRRGHSRLWWGRGERGHSRHWWSWGGRGHSRLWWGWEGKRTLTSLMILRRKRTLTSLVILLRKRTLTFLMRLRGRRTFTSLMR